MGRATMGDNVWQGNSYREGGKEQEKETIFGGVDRA